LTGQHMMNDSSIIWTDRYFIARQFGHCCSHKSKHN